VALGDFNADGHADLAVANEASASVSVLLGTGTGATGRRRTTRREVARARWRQVISTGTATPTWRWRTCTATVPPCCWGRNGQLRGGDELRGGKLPQCSGGGDFDVDGNADLAVANWGSNTISIFLGTGMGSFGGR